MQKFTTLLLFLFLNAFMISFSAYSQIYAPEGLNMPGGWNGWTNPPTNNLAFASSTQVTGGYVIPITEGIARWQTTFHVATSGGDVAGGTYNWLFTSGPSGSPWNNKWAGTSVNIDELQLYTYNSGSDNSITLEDDHWYTMNWEDGGYGDSRAIFMKTSAEPVTLTLLSTPAEVIENELATITLTTNNTPSSEEKCFLR